MDWHFAGIPRLDLGWRGVVELAIGEKEDGAGVQADGLPQGGARQGAVLLG